MGFDFKPVLAEWLKQYEPDVKKVISYEDDTEAGGCCESCYYEYAIVRIEYLDSKDERHEYVYSGGFADIVRSLESM